MAEENNKAGLSFKECRENLLNDLQARAENKIVTKRIRFQNDDVLIFLGRLKEFERKSRKTVLTAIFFKPQM